MSDRPLPREVFDRVPRISSWAFLPAPKLEDVTDTACVICLEEMMPCEEIMILPCLHKYHIHCLETWCTLNSSCPMDRLDIDQMLNLQECSCENESDECSSSQRQIRQYTEEYSEDSRSEYYGREEWDHFSPLNSE